MALVPFRVSGRASGHDLEERLLQFGPHTISLHQEQESSGSSRMATAMASGQDLAMVEIGEGSGRRNAEASRAGARQAASLENVGKVVWQSGFLLAWFLVHNPPLGSWEGVRVVDLGTGTGVVGLALAKAGATVVLTDLPHITPLAAKNAARNGLGPPQCQVVEHAWGKSAEPLGPPPDVVTGGDLIYAPECHAALLDTITGLCAAHTLLFLAHRLRGEQGKAFSEQLSEAGFFVREVSRSLYHPEYQEQTTQGTYHILLATKLP